MPAGDGSEGVVATSVDIFAVLRSEGIDYPAPTPTGRGTGSLKNTLGMSKSSLSSYICVIIRQVYSFAAAGWVACCWVPAKNTQQPKTGPLDTKVMTADLICLLIGNDTWLA